MADYWITFRIADKRDRDDRYERLVTTVKVYSPMHWDEPTSFFLARCSESIDELGRALANTLDEDLDILLIRQIGANTTRYFGTPKDADLFKFFPEIKKL